VHGSRSCKVDLVGPCGKLSDGHYQRPIWAEETATNPIVFLDLAPSRCCLFKIHDATIVRVLRSVGGRRTRHHWPHAARGTAQTRTIVAGARTRAKQMGGSVRTRLLQDEDGRESIVLQFVRSAT
jgi:hypothetical protein